MHGSRTRNDFAEICRQADAPLLLASSIKAGLDIDWNNADAKEKALFGKARRASRLVALRIMRGRWHIENTAFHQWVTQWNLDHCYRHTSNAILAVMHIWILAFT